MEHTVSDYFEAHKILAKRISEVKAMEQGVKSWQDIRKTNPEVAMAAGRIEELIEIFTWETRETDLIRLAFIDVGTAIEKQLEDISKAGLWPDPCNGGISDDFRLCRDISGAFRAALYSHGRYAPEIVIKTTATAWDVYKITTYIENMLRQLGCATFDNLLEAVTYYEKSETLLQLIFRDSDK
ncbi:hypothetical protein SAMN02927921_00458 [Sinomicrobium oceani]|uniref:Uncharacterized protein n=1 Tax=Sinomicrobium oceani TaxID=1150368 RepID=A0A1K1MB53_9FLAO|nr:hypothetical protein [Sinomicrobium oceani]SFW19190.1 hypothetical protein SAMN02927921_00458 [Sinomicrobium oceani]